MRISNWVAVDAGDGAEKTRPHTDGLWILHARAD